MEQAKAATNAKKFFYGWWMVIGATIGWALYGGFYFYGFGAFFDPLVTEFKCSRTLLSGAFSLAKLEGGLTGPPVGWLVDKYGPRKISIIGIAIMGAGFMILSRISSIGAFYLVLLMIALGSGIGFGTPMLTAVGNWFRRKQGLAFSFVLSGLGLGGLFIPEFSSIIANLGWRFAAIVAGITIWTLGTSVALVMRHKPEQYGYVLDGGAPPKAKNTAVTEEIDFTAREALRTPVFWILGISFGLRLMVTGAVPIHIMPFLLDNGFTREVAAGALGSIAVVSIVGRLGFGWIGDRFPKRYVYAGLLALLTASLLLLTQVKTVTQLFLFIALYAPTYGGLAILMQATRGEYFGRKAFGTIMGFMSIPTTIGTVAGPLFAGYVWDTTGNYYLAFIVFAITAFVAMVMILWAKPPVKKTTKVLAEAT